MLVTINADNIKTYLRLWNNMKTLRLYYYYYSGAATNGRSQDKPKYIDKFQNIFIANYCIISKIKSKIVSKCILILEEDLCTTVFWTKNKYQTFQLSV